MTGNVEGKVGAVAGRPPLHWVCLGYDRRFSDAEIARVRTVEPAWVVTNVHPHPGARFLDTGMFPAHAGLGLVGLVLALVRGIGQERLISAVAARVSAAVAAAGGPEDFRPRSATARQVGPQSRD